VTEFGTNSGGKGRKSCPNEAENCRPSHQAARAQPIDKQRVNPHDKCNNKVQEMKHYVARDVQGSLTSVIVAVRRLIPKSRWGVVSTGAGSVTENDSHTAARVELYHWVNVTDTNKVKRLASR